MRKGKTLTPSRYNRIKTSGSNKFVSTFSKKGINDGIVEKRDRKYKWINYKFAVVFTILIAILTYFVIDYCFF